MKLRYDTVIFDMDGTLLDTLDDLADATNHALAIYGYPQRTREEIRSFVGNGVGLLIRRALPENTDEADYEKVLASFKEYYAVHCNDKTCVYEGVPELLDKLKRDGAFVAVVSNKIDSAVQELGKLYFPNNVDFFIGERPGLRRKPEPDMINAVLEAYGRSAERAVYIGDSEVDLATGHAAKMQTILVSWGFRGRKALLEDGAECIVDSAEEIRKIVKKQEEK